MRWLKTALAKSGAGRNRSLHPLRGGVLLSGCSPLRGGEGFSSRGGGGWAPTPGSWPTLANPTSTCVCVCLCVLVCVGVCLCVCVCWFHGFRVGVSRFWFGHVRCLRDRPSRDRPPPDRPNFRAFFPVPPQNSFFSSLSGGLLVEFWWCSSRLGPSRRRKERTYLELAGVGGRAKLVVLAAEVGANHLPFLAFDFGQVPRRNFLQFFPFLVHCCFCCWNFHSLRHRNKFVNQIIMLQ